MQYRVDHEQIESLARRVQQEHEDIRQDINDLRRLNQQLDSAWDGEAQMAFEERFGNWLRELEQFAETLESVYQYLMQFVESRRELEEQARSAAQGAA